MSFSDSNFLTALDKSMRKGYYGKPVEQGSFNRNVMVPCSVKSTTLRPKLALQAYAGQWTTVTMVDALCTITCLLATRAETTLPFMDPKILLRWSLIRTPTPSSTTLRSLNCSETSIHPRLVPVAVKQRSHYTTWGQLPATCRSWTTSSQNSLFSRFSQWQCQGSSLM